MNIVKSGFAHFSFQAMTLGEVYAIRNALGYAVRGGFITPVQREVYEETTTYLRRIDDDVEEIITDPDAFIAETFAPRTGR